MANNTQTVWANGQVGYNSSGTELTLEARTFYDRNLLSRLLPNLVYLSFGQIRPMPRQAGQTVQWRKFESLAIPSAALVEGVTPNPSDLTMSSITVTPEQWGDYVRISDVLDLTGPDPVLIEAGALLGEQAALTMDTKVRDVVAAGTNVQYASTATNRATVGAAMTLTTNEVREAVRTMQTNKAPKLTSIMDASTGVGSKPIAAAYVGVIHPKTLFDLKKEQGGAFVPVHEYAAPGQALPGEVGSVDEVRFIMSTQAPVLANAGNSCDVYQTIIFGRDAFGVVSPAGVENIIKDFGAGDDPLNQRATSGWKAFFKAVRLQEASLLRIEHAASA